MQSQKTTLLITASPNSPTMWQALDHAKNLIKNGVSVSVFFYADGAYVANAFRWQSADVADVADEWVKLAHAQDLTLSVCVSAALARGISDKENATRHGLMGHNLKSPFVLVGLSELAIGLDHGQLIQF